MIPEPWQRLILDDWLREKRGRWASLTCGLAVPRQNGKNGALEVRELFGMVGRGEKILHTAHEVKTAQKHFRRLKHFFGSRAGDPDAKFPELNALVTEVRSVNGQEAIYLSNGGSVELVARSKNSGRGFTVDVLVMDEAQELSDDALEALMPTTSAAPLGNPQWIFTGTPPGPRAIGEVFTRVRVEALAGGSRRLCWHEWSVEPVEGDPVDLDDRALWYATNPALGGRLQLDVIEGERARFSDDGFGRERLGMWADVRSLSVVAPATWAGCVDGSSVVVDPVVFAVDVAPMGRAASISLAGRRADGRFHVETVKNARGTEWLVPALVSLRDRWAPSAIVLDRVGPSNSVILRLQEHRFKNLKLTSSTDMAQACGGFVDAVVNDQVRHVDQPLLNAALGAARKRPIGDAWGWDRRDESQDITPLVSATLALWGFQRAAARVKRSGPSRVVVMS